MSDLENTEDNCTKFCLDWWVSAGKIFEEDQTYSLIDGIEIGGTYEIPRRSEE